MTDICQAIYAYLSKNEQIKERVGLNLILIYEKKRKK